MATGPKRAKPDLFAKTGRRIAIGIYLTGLIYMSVVGFYSVSDQLFFAPSGESAASGSCHQVLSELRDELVEHSNQARLVGAPRTPGNSAEPDGEGLTDTFLSRWDGELADANRVCTGTSRKPYRELRRFRHRLELSLIRIDRDVVPLLTRFDRSLLEISQNE